MNRAVGDVIRVEIERLARCLRWSFGSSAQLSGYHRGRRLGSAGEFEGYRAFEAGDDLARLDLRAYARLRQRVVRVHREDTIVPITIVVDRSGSISTESKRRSIATWLELLLATARSAGDPIRVFTAGDTSGLTAIDARRRSGRAVAEEIFEKRGERSSPHFAAELRHLPVDRHGRGAAIVVGDGFGVTDPQRELTHVARVGLPFWLAFLDEDELHPKAERGPITLVSREHEPEWSGELTADAIADYCQHLDRYHRALRRGLAAHGGDLFVLRASSPIGRQVEQVTERGSLFR